MKTSTNLALALSMGAVDVKAETGSLTGSLSGEDVQAVSPALQRYATDRLANDLWKRPGLSPRDRSIVTVATVITRNQAILLPEQINLALDHGVKPAEISEIITHLAFYAGWGNAMAATAITGQVFEARGIGADQLPQVSADLLALDEKAEAERTANVEKGTGPASQGLGRCRIATGDVGRCGRLPRHRRGLAGAASPCKPGSRFTGKRDHSLHSGSEIPQDH